MLLYTLKALSSVYVKELRPYMASGNASIPLIFIELSGNAQMYSCHTVHSYYIHANTYYVVCYKLDLLNAREDY